MKKRKGATIDESYVREILTTNPAVTRDAFYQICQLDINAGYSVEVAEAWLRRSKDIRDIVRTSYGSKGT